jgi:hypothetical protein
MTTGPHTREPESDTSDVAGKESPTPAAADTRPEAGSESSLNLSKEPILGPERWRHTLKQLPHALKRLLKRLGIWLSDPPWWFSNGLVALFISLVVFALQYQGDREPDAANHSFEQNAQRLENLRFVRESSQNHSNGPFPFAKLDLQGQFLSGLRLPKADFSGANLSGAVLYFTNLDGADFLEANLKGANLLGASLTGAILEGAHLTNAEFSGARLPGADLGGSDLTGADFAYATLTGVRFSTAEFREDANGNSIYYVAPRRRLLGLSSQGLTLAAPTSPAST